MAVSNPRHRLALSGSLLCQRAKVSRDEKLPSHESRLGLDPHRGAGRLRPAADGADRRMARPDPGGEQGQDEAHWNTPPAQFHHLSAKVSSSFFLKLWAALTRAVHPSAVLQFANLRFWKVISAGRAGHFGYFLILSITKNDFLHFKSSKFDWEWLFK